MTVGASATGSIVRVGVVDSTQSIAFALAERGAADRTVVVADEQSAGRGRRGRTWQAPADTSLLVSMLVRPRLPQPLLPTLSPTTAVAAADALRRVTGLAARVKWPNDVLVNGRKIAGILLESRTTSSAGSGMSEPGRTSLRPPSVEGGLTAPATVIIGLGINLGQREFPAELTGRATSVAIEGGRVPDRETMLAALLDEFDAWRARLEGPGFAPVRERWRQLSDTLGRPVTIDAVSGVAVDLDTDGALLVDVAGVWTRVTAGEIGPDGASGPAVRG